MTVTPLRPPDEPRSWDLVHHDRPLPMNAYRTLHFQKRAAYDREWRHTFGWLARQARIPRLPAVVVTVGQECRRPPLPDIGATYPTAKAAIDGLVDAGVLVDDSPQFVRAITFVAPTRGTRDLFVLIVEEWDE